MTDIIGNETLRDLWQSVVDRKGGRHFLTFHNRVGDVFEYTYSEFDEDVNRIANVFTSLNIQKGDHVALHLHSSPEFLMCLFGLSKIGAVVVPINEQYLADEAEYILENSDAVCVVVEPLFYETYQELLERGHYFPKGVLIARAGSESPKSDFDFTQIYTPLGTVQEGQQGIYDFWSMRCEETPVLRTSCKLNSEDPVQIIYT
ncbi:MAG: AMP-binding protein, partial [Anaerotardibacter sp.]